MEIFKITLDLINTVVLDKHNIDLHSLKIERATTDQALFRRCFINLAIRYTDENLSTIARYLNISPATTLSYKKTIDVLTINPYYNQVYVDLIVTLNKVRQNNGVYNDRIDRALERIEELDKEIKMLRKQISEIGYG